MKNKKTRRQYDSDFKRNAIKHVETSRKPLTQVALDLGISSDLLYRWRNEARERGEVAFPGKGKLGLTESEQVIYDLKKQLKDAREERDILKKAVAIFSKVSK